MLPELTVAFPHHRLQQTSGQPALRTLGQSTLSCGWALHGWQLAAPCLCATSSPGPHRVKDLLPTHTSSRAWAHFSTPSAPCVLFYLSSLKGPMCDGGRDGGWGEGCCGRVKIYYPNLEDFLLWLSNLKKMGCGRELYYRCKQMTVK